MRPERGAVPKQEHGRHRQDRCDSVCVPTRSWRAAARVLVRETSDKLTLGLTALPSFSLGLIHKANPYKEKDMSCVPKFTQPLVDRSVVAGYSTAISCAVKGFPKVNGHVKIDSGLSQQETDNATRH